MVIEPFTPRKRSDRELARLQALGPLADQIAEAVLVHIERERCIIKEQLARAIRLELTGAAAAILWEDPPGNGPEREARSVPADEPGPPPRSEVHQVTKTERWIITEALREKSDAFVKALANRRVTVAGRLRGDYQRWSEDANRLARLVDEAAKIDIWADAWARPRPA